MSNNHEIYVQPNELKLFEGVNERTLTPLIMVGKSGNITFNRPFCNAYEDMLKGKPYVKAYYIKSKKIIAFEFVSKPTENKTFTLSGPKTRSIKAKKLFVFNEIVIEDVSGHYSPIKIKVGENNDLIGVQLKTNESPPPIEPTDEN